MSAHESVAVVCPDCRTRLSFPPGRGAVCAECGAVWPLEHGFPKLFRERQVRGSDRFMRLFYNGLPALHDPLTHHLLPRLQGEGSEDALRRSVLLDLELSALVMPRDRPLQILEVGIGAGANLDYVRRALPADAAVVYWGLDLSVGMLRQCRKRLPRPPLDVRLLLGDAHHLPFPDGVFDRVFHVGALGSYRDPAQALSEMARVARPRTPIVAMDEQLDRRRRHNLRDQLAFRLLTFYDRDPHCPVEHLPPAAQGVRVTQASRFYYCLRFSMP